MSQMSLKATESYIIIKFTDHNNDDKTHQSLNIEIWEWSWMNSELYLIKIAQKYVEEKNMTVSDLSDSLWLKMSSTLNFSNKFIVKAMHAQKYNIKSTSFFMTMKCETDFIKTEKYKCHTFCL